MNTQPKPRSSNRFTSIALGGVAVLLAAAVFSGANLTLGFSDRAAFIALLVLGVAMCASAMKLETYGWTNPFNLAGSAIGALTLALSLMVVFNLRIPFVSTDRAAFVAVSVLMALKMLLDLARGVFSRPKQTAAKLAAG